MSSDVSVPLPTASFHILVALASGERHGYSIAKDVERSTEGAVRLPPGTLYRTVKAMLADGWIAEVAQADDERRRVYRLTPVGRRIAVAEARRLERLVLAARAARLLPS